MGALKKPPSDRSDKVILAAQVLALLILLGLAAVCIVSCPERQAVILGVLFVVNTVLILLGPRWQIRRFRDLL